MTVRQVLSSPSQYLWHHGAMKAFIIVLLLALAGLNVWQFADRERLRDDRDREVASVTLKIESVTAPLREEKAKLVAENKALAEKVTLLEQASANQEDKNDDPGFKSPGKAMAEMLENPGMREMMASQQMATLEAQYQRLYETLALEGEELAHFKKLITDAQMSIMDKGMQMISGKHPPEERQALLDEITATKEDMEARVREFLNDDADYDYYTYYTGTLGERMAMTGLRSLLEPAGQALDVDTEEALVKLMYDEREAIGFEDRYYDQNELDPTTLTQEKIDRFMEQYDTLQRNLEKSAVSLLTDEQFEAFKTNQKTSRAMQEMGLTMTYNMFVKE